MLKNYWSHGQFWYVQLEASPPNYFHLTQAKIEGSDPIIAISRKPNPPVLESRAVDSRDNPEDKTSSISCAAMGARPC